MGGWDSELLRWPDLPSSPSVAIVEAVRRGAFSCGIYV